MGRVTGGQCPSESGMVEARYIPASEAHPGGVPLKPCFAKARWVGGSRFPPLKGFIRWEASG